MAFKKDFNEVLNEVLLAYENIGPVEQVDSARLKAERPEIYNEYLIQGPPDLSVASTTYNDAVVLAIMVWGLRNEIHRASQQIFPATADPDYLLKHAGELSIITTGKTPLEILRDIQEKEQGKLAGGNKYDYIEWAKEVEVDGERVTDAKLYPLAQGEGSFDLVIVGSEDNGIPSVELVQAVQAHIDEKRTVCSGFSWGLRVLAPAVLTTNVVLLGSGANWDRLATVSAVTAYMNQLAPMQTLYLSQLEALAQQYGAETADTESPAGNVIPQVNAAQGGYQMIRPGTVETELL